MGARDDLEQNHRRRETEGNAAEDEGHWEAGEPPIEIVMLREVMDVALAGTVDDGDVWRVAAVVMLAAVAIRMNRLEAHGTLTEGQRRRRERLRATLETIRHGDMDVVLPMLARYGAVP